MLLTLPCTCIHQLSWPLLLTLVHNWASKASCFVIVVLPGNTRIVSMYNVRTACSVYIHVHVQVHVTMWPVFMCNNTCTCMYCTCVFMFSDMCHQQQQATPPKRSHHLLPLSQGLILLTTSYKKRTPPLF